jgi:transcriptional regulator with XRE-family HTH domain
MSEVAARIRAARAYAGLTQDELAARLGVVPQTIKRREAGTTAPRRGELLAIAAACQVPAAFLEHGFGDVRPSEIVERLDRIERLLLGEDVDLGPVREYVRWIVTALDEDAPEPESQQPDAPQGLGPRRRGQRPPRAR